MPRAAHLVSAAGARGKRTEALRRGGICGSLLMVDGNAVPAGLFVLGLVMSMAADARLRLRQGTSWRQGCVTAAGAGLTFLACACAIR